MAGRLNARTVQAEIDATLGDQHYRDRREELIAMVGRLKRAESPDHVMSLQLVLRDRADAPVIAELNRRLQIRPRTAARGRRRRRPRVESDATRPCAVHGHG
jgi:hypothetical protein